MSSTTSTSLPTDISQMLGLYDMEGEELAIFLQDVGELIIESATLRYLVELSPQRRAGFESWLEVYQDNENILEEALTVYPEFAAMVTEEMTAFQTEMMRLHKAK
jgi:hypothetical protein